MRTKLKHNGSALLIAIFVTAMLSAVVIGMLQINTEQIQMIQTEIYAAEALAAAEAGLNDAFSEIRSNSEWNAGFTNKVFDNGSYTVTVTDSTVRSTAALSSGFVARVEADITISASSPYIIRIDNLRVNE